MWPGSATVAGENEQSHRRLEGRRRTRVPGCGELELGAYMHEEKLNFQFSAQKSPGFHSNFIKISELCRKNEDRSKFGED